MHTLVTGLPGHVHAGKGEGTGPLRRLISTYACVYIYKHINIYIYICILSQYTHIHLHTHTHTHIYIYMYMSIYIYISCLSGQGGNRSASFARHPLRRQRSGTGRTACRSPNKSGLPQTSALESKSTFLQTHDKLHHCVRWKHYQVKWLKTYFSQASPCCLSRPRALAGPSIHAHINEPGSPGGALTIQSSYAAMLWCSDN